MCLEHHTVETTACSNTSKGLNCTSNLRILFTLGSDTPNATACLRVECLGNHSTTAITELHIIRCSYRSAAHVFLFQVCLSFFKPLNSRSNSVCNRNSVDAMNNEPSPKSYLHSDHRFVVSKYTEQILDVLLSKS